MSDMQKYINRIDSLYTLDVLKAKDGMFYLASDVDASITELLDSQEFHEALMDYRAAGILQAETEFQSIQALVRSKLMVGSQQ
jgi:hypothetical protein